MSNELLDHRILDNWEEQEQQLTDKQVLTQIWFRPKKVFKSIVKTGFRRLEIILFILLGCVVGGNASFSILAFGGGTLWLFLIGYLVGGVIVVYILYLIFSALLSWTGRWFEAEADTISILRVASYANLPVIVWLGLSIPLSFLILSGMTGVQSLIFTEPALFKVYTIISTVLQLGMFLWSAVFWVVGMSVVQKFSYLTALLSLAIAVVIIVIPIAALFVVGFTT